MVTHSSILAWGIPWMGNLPGYSGMESQRVGHDWETKQKQQRCQNLICGSVILFAEVFLNSKHLFLNVFNTDWSFPFALKRSGKNNEFSVSSEVQYLKYHFEYSIKNIEYSLSSLKLIKNFLCSNLLIHFRRIRTVLSSVTISDPLALNIALKLRFNSVIARSTLKVQIQA